jgi:hypothetical protein
MNISRYKQVKQNEESQDETVRSSKVHQTFYSFRVDPYIIADAMCYHIEIAQTFLQNIS